VAGPMQGPDRRCSPASIALVGDATGRGHRSHAVETAHELLAMVQLEERKIFRMARKESQCT
jgi:hypothetical protein